MPPTPAIIAVDLGSSSLRARAYDAATLTPLGPATVAPYPLVREPGGLAKRYRPAVLRERLLAVIGTAARGVGEVQAVGIAAQRGGTALGDAQGRTLHIGPNTDLRAVFEGAALDEAHGPAFHAATGHLPGMFFTPAKLAWWRGNRPATARRIAWVSSLGGWAVATLTGAPAETAGTLNEQGLADARTGAPPSLLAALGVEARLLPPVSAPGAPAGALSAQAAAATGLRAGTPVVLAGPDAQAAALGTGTLAPGGVCVAAGWSAPAQRVTAQPVFDPARRTWTGLHLAPGAWVCEANPGETGGAVEAVRRLLRAGSRERFERLAASAGEEAGMLTALWGPRALDMSSPGMSLGGLLLPVPLTVDGLSRAGVARAVLANAAFAVAECVRLTDAVAGPTRTGVALAGGMSASPTFAGLLADALDTPIAVHGADATARGAALAASRPPEAWAEAAAGLATGARVREPGPDAGEVREEQERWLALRAVLDEAAQRL
jgi:sugar (pentulose or hexulose) kinase